MAAYDSEQDQIEEIKKWWKENGSSVIIGVLLGFILLFGWRGWEYYTSQRAELASSLYESILFALEQGQADKARGAANTLLSEYSKSPYATLAQLNLAAQDLKENNLNSSHARLQWIIDQNTLPQLTHIARLRKAKLFLSEAKREEAKKLLSQVPNEGAFKSGYMELKGDLALAEGQVNEARKAYVEVLAQSADLLSSEQRNVVQTKLDNLGMESRIEAPIPVSSIPPPPVEATATPSTTGSQTLPLNGIPTVKPQVSVPPVSSSGPTEKTGVSPQPTTGTPATQPEHSTFSNQTGNAPAQSEQAPSSINPQQK